MKYTIRLFITLEKTTLCAQNLYKNYCEIFNVIDGALLRTLLTHMHGQLHTLDINEYDDV